MDGSGEITEFRAAQYVRMSTEHQQYSTHNQSDKIREYADKRGIEIIKTYADDGKSGLSIGGRAALQQLIADVESGAADFNVILVYDVRLGRDIRDLLNIVEELNDKGVAVEFVSERLKFSKTEDDPLARLQLHMLAAFAQWERNISKVRQAEGIARAKATHPEKYKGRPVSIDTKMIETLKAEGLGASAIAKELGIGRASVYRHLKHSENVRPS